MADGQATTNTGSILCHVRVLDAAVIVDANTTTVALSNSHTCGLTLIDETVIYLAATIHVDTTTTL